MIVSLLSVACSFAFGGDLSAGQHDSVVRVSINSLSDLRLIQSLSDDMWSHTVQGGSAEFLVHPEQLDALNRTHLRYCVVIDDVQALVNEEARRLASPPQGGVADNAWFADFKDLAACHARLDALIAMRPDIVTPISAGLSLEGRPLRGIRISYLAPGTPAPAVLLDAAQHAREWGAAMTGMYMADRLVETADTDAQVHALLTRAEVFVIPIVNPDGYAFTWADPANRLWRKNRRNNGDGTFGVDTNRNWGYQWGGAGSSNVTSSETYRGTSAFSEPETQAMRDFYIAHPNIVANIDFHSYSQLVLSPWGWTVDPSADQALFQSIGDSMKAAIAAETGVQYTAGPIGSTLYLAAGGSVDWSYGARGALSWTIEVRDTGGYGFVMPPAEILPCARENFAAAMTMALAIANGAVISLPAPAPVSLVSGVPTPVAVNIREQVPGAVASRHLVARINGGQWQTTDLSTQSGDSFIATLPAAACGSTIEWYIDVPLTSGSSVRYPPQAPASTLSSTATAESTLFTGDFESQSAPWTYSVAGDNATSGQWMLGDPIATTAQSEDDHTPTPGINCAFTGQGTVGGAAGSADVDGGTTTLQSPVMATMVAGAHLRYWYWYTNNLGGSPNLDSMAVQVSGDGIAWVTAQTVSSSAVQWREGDIALDSLVAVGAGIRVRFVASDLGAGSLVEAAIDDVRVVATACPQNAADVNGDGVVNVMDLTVMLSQWGGSGAADINGDGFINGSDLTILLANWS